MTSDSQTPKRQMRLRAIALPAEHGSYSLVSEPILLGLLVAPGWAGLLIAVSGVALFLLRRPFGILWSDWRRGKWFARTAVALRFLLLYAAIAVLALLVAVWLAGLRPLLPLVLASPFLLLHVVYVQKPGRHWQAELAAPTGFAAISASIALAAGWSEPAAFALWAVMIARSVTAVLYVRARLRLAKSKPAQSGLAIGTHVLALLAVGVIVWQGWLPETAVLAMVILLLRALFGLSRFRRDLKTTTLGFIETGFGLLTVLLVAAGYW